MFKPSKPPSLFGFENELSNNRRTLLENSKEKWFYRLVFSSIHEHDFRALYSDKASRPSMPVNIQVSASILNERKGISFDELVESVMFDLRFNTALGLEHIDTMPFSGATIFSFRNGVLPYQEQTGNHLIDKVFDNLSAKQTKQRRKVRSDMNICKQCQPKNKRQIYKSKGRYYFGHTYYMLNRWNNNINTTAQNRQKIRPNIEASVKQFRVRTPNGKVKVRGLLKTSIFAFRLGIAINFGRIYKYLIDTGISGPILFEKARIGVGNCVNSLFFNSYAQKTHIETKNLAFFQFLSALLPNKPVYT